MPVLVNYVDRGLSKGQGMVQLNLIQATVCGWKKRSQNCLNSEYPGIHDHNLLEVYVVVQFYPWFKFYFLLFQTHYHTLPYPKTKGNKI